MPPQWRQWSPADARQPAQAPGSVAAPIALPRGCATRQVGVQPHDLRRQPLPRATATHWRRLLHLASPLVWPPHRCCESLEAKHASATHQVKPAAHLPLRASHRLANALASVRHGFSPSVGLVTTAVSRVSRMLILRRMRARLFPRRSHALHRKRHRSSRLSFGSSRIVLISVGHGSLAYGMSHAPFVLAEPGASGRQQPRAGERQQRCFCSSLLTLKL